MSKLGALHLTKHTGLKHTATIIFFHGSGSCGADMKEWVHIMLKSFTFPHVKVVYPTAPLQPYTPAGGQLSNVWFDRSAVSAQVPERQESLSNIATEIQKVIQEENDSGIPTNRIIVGGFSMGGALALQVGYRWSRRVAGVFAFSSFLNDDSAVYQELRSASGTPLPPLLQLHGDNDELVNLTWGETTFRELTACGVSGQFHVMQKLGHSINKQGMNLIKDWVEELLPES